MAQSEHRQFLVAATDPVLAWLRLLIAALCGIALLAPGSEWDLEVAWAVLIGATLWAVVNGVVALYRRYRRFLTRRVYAAIDLILITVLVAATSGAESPLFLLYAFPLVVAVLQHGLDAGAYYGISASVLHVTASIALGQDDILPILVHLGLLWSLYLLLGYVAYTDDVREERARRRDELGALHRAAAAPMHTGDIPTVVENVLSGALGATSCTWGGVFLYDEVDDRFTTLYALRSADRDGVAKQESPNVTAADVLYTVLYTGTATTIADLRADSRLKSSVLSNQPIRSAIVAPLVAPGAKKVGILALGRETTHRASHHEMRFVGTIAMQAAVAVHTAFLFEEAASMEAAKEADRLRSQLLGTVSHELRTPIAAIQGFASSLRCKDELDVPKEMEQDWILEIESNAERLKRLVTDLLDLSRLEAGALHMVYEWHDLSDVIEDVQHNLEILAGTRKVIVRVPEHLPLVRCDAQRIGQVLSNLVENAAKFSPADSEIIVGAERFEGGVRIGVLDQGVGIPSEFQDKVFERFYQVESSSFRPQKGTGLGLAICRSIVEAHGGRIWVESQQGQGSIFYFTLPSPAPSV